MGNVCSGGEGTKKKGVKNKSSSTPMSSVQAVKPVLVIGSTGNIGNATVTALAAKGTPTRAGVRDPASEKAVKLASLEGVEVVSAAHKRPTHILPLATAEPHPLFEEIPFIVRATNVSALHRSCRSYPRPLRFKPI